MKNIYRAGALILMALSLAGFAWSAPSVTLLYSFGLDSSKGKGHVSGLIVGQQGALYGTTSEGGANGYGTVFKLIPPALPGGSWKETVLYSFCQQPQCFDGSYPIGRLVAYQGALYGTTTYGGNDCGWSGCGTIFKLLPPVSPGGPWTYAVIYYFKTAGDGTNPMAGLIVDQQGVLYGTTTGGGQYGNGTVFKLPQDTGHGWNETVLYSFAGGNDGDSPMGDLTFDAKGNLYGTTQEGGANGYGTVFKLKPPASARDPGQETVLYSFTGGNDGAYPMAGLLADAKGGLYGTTTYGGAHCDVIDQCGTVFKMVPPDKLIPRWTLSRLHSFNPNNTDGLYPVAGLTFGEDGAIYGTTKYGGVNPGGPGSGKERCGFLYSCGTIFKLTGSQSAWNETVIYKFCAGEFCTTGAYPTAGLVAYQGALYGTTSFQGSGYTCNCGTVFKLDD
jgi:uncharacterized repeat protein (TIGR03803 family)